MYHPLVHGVATNVARTGISHGDLNAGSVARVPPTSGCSGRSSMGRDQPGATTKVGQSLGMDQCVSQAIGGARRCKQSRQQPARRRLSSDAWSSLRWRRTWTTTSSSNVLRPSLKLPGRNEMQRLLHQRAVTGHRRKCADWSREWQQNGNCEMRQDRSWLRQRKMGEGRKRLQRHG